MIMEVARAGQAEVHAAVRGRGQAARVEGDPAGGEEHGVRDRYPEAGADVVRPGFPRDVEDSAGRGVGGKDFVYLDWVTVAKNRAAWTKAYDAAVKAE